MDKKEIIDVIQQHVETNVEITEDSQFFNDLGLSSLSMFSLFCELEEKTGKKINIMDFVGLKTVGELIAKINNNKS